MNTNYQIFYEPNTNKITSNSIVRIDTKNLSSVTELTNWEYKIKDQYQDTYYIMPLTNKRGAYKNIEIKKGILEATKKINDFRIELMLWHMGNDEEGEIFNDLLVYDNSVESFETVYYYADLGETLKDTQKNIEILKAEQKKLYNYLKKHFNNITINEMNM